MRRLLCFLRSLGYPRRDYNVPNGFDAAGLKRSAVVGNHSIELVAARD
jgi:hypothetical protein